ncbi:hypothetical protein AGABI2DRAFT_194359 [Agaricus bisporus var. bisporus H97]|uniref:hypothetical protein n=1 Tax=Agaricus bisporus var. bisporus (strain H97 / ATCC MYA-4626 / FGSC 10389) TaxID=936046 RepID=UPI00029F74DC|nr:hypothetical protein AGABI2DRAFT_194359 [Agaricus bisporus var. bisporus H97]EKV45426.1 hypothetical protein AGABI2DRAFT_194359 [Agaricus bisporus var. bisporus H97]
MDHQQLVPVQFPLPNIQADQLPPPDWDAVGNALATLGQQAHRMAQVNVQAQLNALLNGMNQMINGINNLGGHITALDQRTARIEAELTLLPMRIFNASASDTAPLAYPPPHVSGGALPKTKYDAHRINGAEALAALQALGVLNIPHTEAERIKAFHDYIGLRVPTEGSEDIQQASSAMIRQQRYSMD